MADVAGSTMDTLTSSWSMINATNRPPIHRHFTMPASTKTSTKHTKRHSMSSNQSRARQFRPKSIQLPSQDIVSEDVPLCTPSLQSTWSKGPFPEPVMTPVDSPEGMYTNFWVAREGSVISSTSSNDSRERLSSLTKHGKLERPFVGQPRESRERCMSVSLVVGANGTAQIRKEEVEVEFLQSQKDTSLTAAAAMMKRMISSAGSDASVSRNFNNMSLVNSTRGEVLVRSTSQQTDLGQNIPLTPCLSEHSRFVSPEHLNKSSRIGMQRSASTSMLRTPESFKWHDYEGQTDGDDDDLHHSISGDDDAQAAVQKAFDRKKGKVAQGFVGSTMPMSPLAPHHSHNSLACSACQIVFRSSSALANHTPRCSVKQTPFASADFFGSVDMFGMSNDFMFMPDLTEELPKEPISPLPFSALLDPAFYEDESILEMQTPRKRSRFDRLPSLSPTPTPARLASTSINPTTKRKR